MTCRWANCARPCSGYWCPDHAARLADARTTLDAERQEDQ